jgi:hypothetical protein
MMNAETTQTGAANMNAILAAAAAIIGNYNPQLAKAWDAQPFRRVTIANAFAAGFAADPGDDIHQGAALVIRAALLDRESRN